MKKKLAIICADSFQIPLVNKAKEMGIETHCFAWEKREQDTVCKGIADFFHPISVVEKEKVLEKCREIKINGVTSVRVDFAIPTVAFVAQNMGLPGNSYEDMLIPINKISMYQTFQKHGVSLPRFAIVNENIDLTGFNYPLVVKPADNTGSYGVIKVEKKEDLQWAIEYSKGMSRKGEVIVSEFIAGSEVSIDSISWNGKHYFLAIKDKEFIKNNKDFILLAEHFPSQLSFDIQENIKTETLKILDVINFKYGVANTQFKINEKGELFAIEVNPRMPGDQVPAIMKLHNGFDLLKGVIDVALGQFDEPVFTNNQYSGSYYFHDETPWAGHIIENAENDPDIIEAILFEEEEKFKGYNGYFLYQSDKKRRFSKNLT